jgi:hypothetical protein
VLAAMASTTLCAQADKQEKSDKPAEWVIAASDVNVFAGERFEILVVSLAGEPLPDEIEVRMRAGPEEQITKLSAVSAPSDSRRSYSGTLPAGLTGPVSVDLAGRASSVLVLMVAASRTDPVQAFVSRRVRSGVAAEPPLSENDPMYFVAGGRDGYSARFQLSLKYRLFDQSAGFGQGRPWLAGFYFGYTQNSLWDLSQQSKPFRDTSYRPSLFWKWEHTDDQTWIDSVRLGVEHESNGGGGERSRSINVVFMRTDWRWSYADDSHFELTPKFYGYIEKSDNPDIARYRGNVITNAGNGVLFVGARESWYPHFGDASDFCFHDLTLHWPKRLRLVATGEKTDEREEGEFRVGHWTSPQPVSEAGFNLGEYAVSSITSVDRSIDVYANRQLEQAILSRLAPPPASALDPSIRTPVGESGRLSSHVAAIGITPSPADALKQLARDIDSSIHFYEQYGGPFPFRRLSVSQIPGTFGQGWPGLLYLSTISFLPHEAQQRIGLNSTGQEQFSDIVPFHEVAHQWWGNVVGWSSYRDQWLDESIAAYLSLLFADSQKNTDHALHAWLDRYRKRLITKSPGEDLAPVDVGPLTMGSRLSSSKSPEAYDVVIYSKGAWVIHMLREMLRQPNTANPDARFIALLRTLSTKYARAPLSTDQFQHEVESVMTPKMDLEGGRSMEWFFDQYVRGTGIPRYKVDFTSRRVEKGFQVRGTLYQSGVPRSFIAPVPLYISAGPGKSVFLGTVTATGEETRFSFTSPNEPHKLLIDPHQTLLCIPE